MILYGITTDASIGGLFIVGIVPCMIMALVFMAWAVFRCSRSQTHIKRDPRATGAEMLKALRKSIWSIALPVFVLGGMYLGVFTATEAAAAGVWLALFVTIVIYRTIGWRDIWASAQDACRLSARLFMIFAGEIGRASGRERGCAYV